MAARKKPEPESADIGAPEPGPKMIDLSDFEDEPEKDFVGDVFSPDPMRLEKLRAKGVDVRLTRVRVEYWKEGKRARIPGEWPPEQCTTEQLLKRWGPGLYQLRGVNDAGNFIAGARLNVEAIPGTAAAAPGAPWNPPQPSGYPNGQPAPAPSGGLTFEQQLLMAVLAGRQQQPHEPDPMRDAVGSIVKLMALQLQMQASQKQAGPDERLYALLERMMATPVKHTNGSGPPLAEFMPILNMGIALGTRIAGAGAPGATPEDDLPPWLRVVPEIADTVGVPLLVTLAQAMLSPEKAKMVLDAITEHSQARKAEAEADGDPPVEVVR